MAARSDPPYDPYIPSNEAPAGGSQGGQNPNNQRTAALQAVSIPIHFRSIPDRP